MATLPELARLTTLDAPSVDHLQRLVGSWGFLADLCFADLLLFVPTARPQGNEPDFVVMPQVRPTPSQPLYRDDQVGDIVSARQRPDVARAWHLGQIIDDERRLSVRGEVASIQCIPVRWKQDLLAILTRESAPSVGRRSGELERVYLEIFDRFGRMMAAGEFPFEVEEEPNEAPRVGDGIARLDDAGRVDFASPNFVSSLHRMGIHRNVLGARLGELGMDESAVRASFAIGVPITEEVERNDVTLLMRCIPLLDRGEVTGAVVAVRDVSDLRRRDRLLSPDRPVRLDVEGEAGALRAEVATPLAVVLTELLQNAVRHGFPDDRAQEAGTVRVCLYNDGSRLAVEVVDNGVGFPDG